MHIKYKLKSTKEFVQKAFKDNFVFNYNLERLNFQKNK